MARDRKIIEHYGVQEYATKADFPPASDPGPTTIYARDTKAHYKTNGTEWIGEGYSDSIADRPSASSFGKGTWQIGNNIYTSNQVAWVLQDDIYGLTLPSSGAQVLDITPVAIITSTGTSSSSSASTISGWGGKFNTPADATISHFKIRSLAQWSGGGASEKWHKIIFTVYAGTKDGAVVATGEHIVVPYATSIANQMIELYNNGAPVILTNAILGSTYFVMITATNRDGVNVGFGYPFGSQSNFIAGSGYYIVKATGVITASPATVIGGVEPWSYSAKQVIPAASQVTNELLLPPVYAVVGRECNVYFDGLTSEHYDRLAWDVTCAIGTQQNERFTVIPVAAAASEALTISALDPATLVPVATKASTIKVAAANAAGTLNCLFIGDSTTAGGEVVTEVNTLDTADAAIALTMLGTQGAGANLHEGRGGWSTNTFTTTGSPFFVGGKIDFAGYMTANAYAAVDRVIINLGINDVFNATTDNEAKVLANIWVSNISKLITSIQEFSATCQIGVAITTTTSHSQDSFGKSYGSQNNLWRSKRNLSILYSIALAKFSNQTANKIWVLPYNVSVDTVNNMQTETVAVNSRNATNVVRQSNGVHPAASGYLQIADVAYAWIKCTL